MIAVVKKNKSQLKSAKPKDGELRFLTPLPPLKSRKKPREIWGFDVETYGMKNRFVLGVVSTPSGNYRFTDPKRMLDFIIAPSNYKVDIFATNLEFDMYALFQSVYNAPMPDDGDWQILDIGTKILWAKKKVHFLSEEKQQNRYITLLDSMNLFPLSVENLGNILQKAAAVYRRKGELDKAAYFDVKKLIAPSIMGKKTYSTLSISEREALFTYCEADATVTRKFMEWAVDEITRLGAKVQYTAASTAMDLFRRRYLQSVVPQPSWECMVDSRYSYYGGRTEDYWKGNVGEGDEQDVTAMYPSVMELIEFPYPSPENFRREDSPTDNILQFEGFASANVTIPEHLFYPPLPYKSATHLLFPTGTITGVWTHLQLRHAIKLGCDINHINWSYFNTKTFNPFKDYVKNLIQLRLYYLCPGCERSDKTGRKCWEDGVKCENSDAVEEVIKLFLNSLYGKFAQNFLNEEEGERYNLPVKKGGGTLKPIAHATIEEFNYTIQNYPHYAAQGLVVNSMTPKLRAFMNPIIASYITSAAQVKINEYQLAAHKLGINTYYTDTDSLLTSSKLPFAVKGKILGELQHVGHFDQLIIIGPKAKLVKTGEKSKATFKGVPSKSIIIEDTTTMAARQVKPRQELFDNLATDELSVTFTRFARHKEAMARGLSVNEMILMTKTFKPFENPKRHILGKPTVSSLLDHSYKTVPWCVQPDGTLSRPALTT